MPGDGSLRHVQQSERAFGEDGTRLAADRRNFGVGSSSIPPTVIGSFFKRYLTPIAAETIHGQPQTGQQRDSCIA